MNIGVLGGTFDPIHSGHIQLARSAWEEGQLDHVMLIPAGDPKLHKFECMFGFTSQFAAKDKEGNVYIIMSQEI